MIGNIRNHITGWLASFCVAVMVVFIIKTFIGMPTTVKGTSMATTLFPDDKLFLSTWSSNFGKVPDRGDIITFEAPSVENPSNNSNIAVYIGSSRSFKDKFLYYSLGISKSSYIKRVIGLPGDHIEIKDGSVYVNGQKLYEDYLKANVKTDMSLGGNYGDVIVPENCVYVLGDNRAASVDSRRFGCIPVSKIEGKVIARWWPSKKIGVM